MYSIRLVFLTFIVFAAVLHLSFEYVTFVDCGSFWSIDNITVEGCQTSHNCVFTIGRNTSMSFVLNSGEIDIDDILKNNVSLLVGGVNFPAAVVPSDPCDTLLCPVAKGYVKMYSAEVAVDNRFSPVYGTLQWVISTSLEMEQLVCFQFPIVLMNAD